jgi:hypothetical protein
MTGESKHQGIFSHVINTLARANSNRSGIKHRLLRLLPLGIPALGLGFIIYRLRTVPGDTLNQMLEGFALVFCALLGLGALLWFVSAALAKEKRKLSRPTKQ